MNLRPFFIILLLALSVTLSTARNVLKYDRPAHFFEESIVIGNGNIGAIIYGNPVEERISLNDITLWTGEPDKNEKIPGAAKALEDIRKALDREDYRAADSLHYILQGHYSENYQPLGSLLITYKHHDNYSGYSRSLDIDRAIASVGYKNGGYDFTTEYFASAPDSLIVVKLSTNNPQGINAQLKLESQLPHTVKATGKNMVSEGYAAYKSYPVYTGYKNKHLYDPERGMRFMTIVNVDNKGGKVTTGEDGTIVLENVKEAVLRISNVTSFNGFNRDPAKEGRNYKQLVNNRIENALKLSYKQLLNRHLKDYRNLFGRVEIDFGKTSEEISMLPTDVQLKLYTDSAQVNPDLEELYFQYGRYLLISSSRTPEVPATLQGLWNEKILPPWSSNYTININTEENYWPAENTNLSELHMPLISFLKNVAVNGSETAKNYFGANGWLACHNTDIWAMANPVGEQGGHPSWANWTMGGAWLATHIWEHYMFTGDKEFLKEYYPVLKGAAQFCMDYLVEKNGELITSPSTSPENIFRTPDGYYGSTLYGGTADLAVTRECVADAVEAAKVLGIDNSFVDKADSVLKKLRPYHIGKNGNLMEWYHDWDDQDPRHRHQSHLIGLYPGHQITVESTPDLAKASARTLEIKGDNTTGWSTGWRANLYARLHDSEGAYRIYRRLLRYISPDEYKGEDARRGGGTYPNLLDAHSPFQIDGNFGGTAGVAEMLIQSTPDKIELLPALPKQWADGSVKGLKARGGFEVSMKWADGKVTECEISSVNGGETTVMFNGRSVPVSIKPGKKVKLQ